MAQYLYKDHNDPAFYRLINQAGVRAVAPPDKGNETFNTCWDGALSPDGVFYYTLSSEAGKCDHAKLVRYNYEKNAVEDCVYTGDVVLPQIRQLPHSKFHTSINFRPKEGGCGYIVIGTTHNTDRSPFHEEWMPFGHHNHVWEGFPGSQIIVFDPDTGESESWGTPVPHESIYGAKYDPKHDRLYMIGFMRGHVYSFDCKTRKVEDLGKAAEVFNYRLFLGADGNIYSCTKSGEYYRINTETNKLEDLHFHIPEYPGAYVNNTWYRYLACARNHASGEFMYCVNNNAWEMFAYNFKTGAFTTVGRLKSRDGYFPLNCDVDYGCANFAVDKYGVIRFEQRVSTHNSMDRTRFNPYYSHLFRWDVENGKEPEMMGVMGTPERNHGITVEMEYDEVHDRLYTVDHGRGFGHDGPCVICIDLPEFRKHMYEPGPYTDDPKIHPREISEEDFQKELARRKLATGEENTEKNPFQAFPIAKTHPVRLWNAVLTPEDSAVIGMVWKPSEMGGDILHVVTGAQNPPGAGLFDAAKYVFQMKDWEILSRADFDLIKPEYREWLRENILPQPVAFDEGIKLPEATGRRYRATASATALWHDGRTFVGTHDAFAALVSPDGEVFSLGAAAAYGPVRCICTNAAHTKLWGVAGDVEDMGYVFTYDDLNGLRQCGMLNYNAAGFYRPTASNVLSSIAVNADETRLAIGGADRLGTVHVVEL